MHKLLMWDLLSAKETGNLDVYKIHVLEIYKLIIASAEAGHL